MKNQTLIFIVGIIVLVVGGAVLTTNTTLQPKQPQKTPSKSWQTYENSRFGYVLSVPASFTPQGLPSNNDGRTFVNPTSSGSTTIRVYGRHNTEGASLSMVVGDQTQPLDNLQDANVSSSSAVLYGSKNGRQQVIKILWSTDTLAILRTTNPGFALSNTEQDRLLQEFQWSKKPPSNQQQSATSTTDRRPISFTPDAAQGLIQVQQPSRTATITSPLTITGQARGQWFF